MAKKAKVQKDPDETRIKQVGVRATNAWASWLERGAEFCRTNTSQLLDVAVVDYLKARGFEEPRLPGFNLQTRST